MRHMFVSAIAVLVALSCVAPAPASKGHAPLLDAAGRRDFARAKLLGKVTGNARLVYTARVTPRAPFDRGVPRDDSELGGVGLQAGTPMAATPDGKDLQWNVNNDPDTGFVQLPSSGKSPGGLQNGPYAGLRFTSHPGESYLVYCTRDRAGGTIRWQSIEDPRDGGEILEAAADFAILTKVTGGGSGYVDLRFAIDRAADALLPDHIHSCRLFALRV